MSVRCKAVPALVAVLRTHAKRLGIVLPCLKTLALLCQDPVRQTDHKQAGRQAGRH